MNKKLYEEGERVIMTAHRSWEPQENKDVFETEYSFDGPSGPADEGYQLVALTAEEAEELNRSGRFTRTEEFH